MATTQADREHRMGTLRAFLLAQIDLFNKSATQHQWPWEVRRWHELAFCLLTTVSSPTLSRARARELTFIFADLGLLDVPTLASTVGEQGRQEARRVVDTAVYLLEREGLTSEVARRAMGAIQEAAAVVQSRYGGQIQRYLRAYGERMLSEIDEYLPGAQLSHEERGVAFTLWLQNVINMPLSIMDPAVLKLCADFDLPFQDVRHVTDELGLNLALLDDVTTAGAMLAQPK